MRTAIFFFKILFVTTLLLADNTLIKKGETHFKSLKQLTNGGENAEAYWIPESKKFIFQANNAKTKCDQIFIYDLEENVSKMVSPGSGRATCGYSLYPEKTKIIFSSTHHVNAECPPPPDLSKGYVWALYNYDIFMYDLESKELSQLTHNPEYDAEATVCPLDGRIVFTSLRNGDLDLYILDPKTNKITQLTNKLGYDGGAFFSNDCKQIVWRAYYPLTEEEKEEYKELLKRRLIKPNKLEIWVANSDGSNPRKITYLNSASFAPSFFKDGKRIIFSTNFSTDNPREFELWAIDIDGTRLERITYSKAFDGFPHFSPDGTKLLFASNRNNNLPGETNIFLADWKDKPIKYVERAEDRIMKDIRWLADDARQGRGLGSKGLRDSAEYLAQRFKEIGLKPGIKDAYLQTFHYPFSINVRNVQLEVDGEPVEQEKIRPSSFSASGKVTGEVVDVNYGIVDKEIGWDDFKQKNLQGKIALIRRFSPEIEEFKNKKRKRFASDLRRKATNAKMRGAEAVIFFDDNETNEAPFPSLEPNSFGDVGIPVIFTTRDVALQLTGKTVTVDVDLETKEVETWNVVGYLEGDNVSSANLKSIVIGAHYDHLGMGGEGSLEEEKVIHNGADDNASGIAVMLEVAKTLSDKKLAQRVWFVAFSAEEKGLGGSAYFVKNLPGNLKVGNITSMINIDMVGRMVNNTLIISGTETAKEWEDIIKPICISKRVNCKLGGGGFGPSDHTSFYAEGIPVIHLFTGAHEDYHRASDDYDKINAAGAAQTSKIISELVEKLSHQEATLTLVTSDEAPPFIGDSRGFRASLGVIPNYSQKTTEGLSLLGVRKGGAAYKAGIKKGDILVRLGEYKIRNIYDLTYALEYLKPGDVVKAVVKRNGKTIEVEVTLEKPRQIRGGAHNDKE